MDNNEIKSRSDKNNGVRLGIMNTNEAQDKNNIILIMLKIRSFRWVKLKNKLN